MRHAFALIISVFCLNTLFSQQASLGFAQNGVSITVGGGNTFSPDSVPAGVGASLLYRLVVQNTGAVSFNDFVDLVITPDTAGAFSDTVFSGTVINLNPGDTTSIVIQDSFDTSSNRYTPSGGGGGVIVVVVWPAARSSVVQVTDTVRITFMVDPLSTTKGWEGRGLSVSTYPNPTTSKLYIDYGTLKKEVGYVRFLDMNGREVFYSGNHIEQVDLSDWPSGTYYLSIGGNENQSAVYKVVKR